MTGVNPLVKVKRFCKEERKKIDVECPLVVAEYNAHMGGIDKSDMLVHLYKTPMKAKRWRLRVRYRFSFFAFYSFFSSLFPLWVEVEG